MTTNIYFPKTDAVTFEQANTSQITGTKNKYGFDHVSLQQRWVSQNGNSFTVVKQTEGGFNSWS